jgi:hypothetical protein
VVAFYVYFFHLKALCQTFSEQAIYDDYKPVKKKRMRARHSVSRLYSQLLGKLIWGGFRFKASLAKMLARLISTDKS